MASHFQLRVTIVLILCYETAAQIDPSFNVRLENGLYNNSGRVEVYHDGQWGGICGDSWNYNDATVVCRMFGYLNGTTAHRYETHDSAWYEWFGNETEPSLVWMGRVRCTGMETSLADCPFDGWDTINCNEYYGRAYVFCYDEDDTEVDVRLVGGTSDGSGHVEVHYSSYWGSVCWDGFDNREAEVVCRMLGYSYGISYGGSTFSFTKQPKWMDEIQCNGTETNIADCPFRGWGDISSPWGIATALCYNDSQATDEQHGVRLMDNVSNTSGAVEVMYGGQWTLVCGQNWGDSEARIVCRMLGYRNGTAQMYARYPYESAEDIGLKTTINCTGSESNIYECTFSGVQRYCNSLYGRGGVSCSEPLSSSTTQVTTMPTVAPRTTDSPFAIRLENGLYNNSGRVGVYHDGQWGGICSVYWSYNDANVACRMLGYTNGTITTGYTLDSVWYEWFGNETDPDLIWMSSVQCTGLETSLADCPFDGWGVNRACGRAYVFCYTEDDSQMEVQLVNGRSDGYGHVEVHYSSVWGGVYWQGFWDKEAQVVCRMLGYSHGIQYGDSLVSFTKVPRWIKRQCTGDETSFADCPFVGLDQTNGYTLGIATALCYNDSQVTDQQQGIRLMDNVSNTSGAVEVMYGGQWTLVCDENWDDSEAGIVCRMLGYRNGTAQSYSGYPYDSAENMILKIHVNCLGLESSIYECSFSDAQSYCNSPYGRGGVSCSDLLGSSTTQVTTMPTATPTTTDSPFAIRLENGLYNNSGRVGVYHDGQWGGICDVFWNYNDANVACRMLGYTNGTITNRDYTLDSVWYEWFGNETDPDLIWMDGVQCTGTETSLADCPFDGWGVDNCDAYYKFGHAYVFCYNEDDSQMEVRLVNGRSDGYGHVEVHYSSIWGGVHHDPFYNSEAQAAVVICRMLGYSHGIHYGGSVILFTTVPRWMKRQCTGRETSFADCPFVGWDQTAGSNYGIATALCYNDSQDFNEQRSVYLVDGESGSSGAVEVVYGGQRTLVCGENWGDIEAGIVCRMLDFRNGTARYYVTYAWESAEDIILKTRVNCTGSESSIYECTFSDVRTTYCNYLYGRGGVSCSDPLDNSTTQVSVAVNISSPFNFSNRHNFIIHLCRLSVLFMPTKHFLFGFYCKCNFRRDIENMYCTIIQLHIHILLCLSCHTEWNKRCSV